MNKGKELEDLTKKERKDDAKETLKRLTKSFFIRDKEKYAKLLNELDDKLVRIEDKKILNFFDELINIIEPNEEARCTPEFAKQQLKIMDLIEKYFEMVLNEQQ